MHDDATTGDRDAPRRPAHRSPDQERSAETYVLVLTQWEAYTFLVRTACDHDTNVCEDSPCEVCDEFVRTWAEIYAALPASYRLKVEEALSALGVPTPRRRQGGC